MRPAISLAPETGTSRWQADDEIGNDELAHDISYVELLGCQRSDYERQDVAKPKPAQMAQVSWSTADVLRNASNLAFALEAHSRGMKLVAVKNILAGGHASGKKKHKRQKRKGN